MSTIVYHVDEEPVEDVIDGKLYVVPPNEPFEIEDDRHAQLLIEHKAYHGITQVNATRTRSGVHFDLDEADDDAYKRLKASDEAIVQQYVRTQIEDRLRHNFPALPPQGRAEKVIKRRQVDLKAVGVDPAGFKLTDQAATSGDRLAKLERENQGLKQQLDAVLGRLEQLLTGGGVKVPEAPPAAEPGPLPSNEPVMTGEEGQQAEEEQAPPTNTPARRPRGSR